MSVFKCKMCGGTIEFNPGDTVGVCDSCGTKQTLPRLDDEKRANLYDRANHFRRDNEFDKAAGIYEQILNEDGSDAEAYWSLVLCRYGIEYVEDAATKKRVPTVNRAQYTSVFDDDNYKSALKYADGYQKAIYEEEAKTINDIQKGILEISQKEEPFDVFICYKENDSAGRRTPDSVLANDLYHQLTREGFKVFFARITLEDKLGTAYEPYIFAALNSAKVMVVLGTKPEYFNAVWVKNEWSRYLSLIKNGADKMLVPAYKDMDPYDLPEEFSHLQAQDMSKLGFMQDLIRGIKKIVNGGKSEKHAQREAASANGSVKPLIERVFLFLEDEKWQDANIYCEKVLDKDPRNAEAYLGKLMAELHVKNRKQLANEKEPFDNSDNYAKVLRFGDEKIENEMRGYIAHINERNENDRMTGIYNSAVNLMNVAESEYSYITAAQNFQTISGFKDADALTEQCLKKAETCRKDDIYRKGKLKMSRKLTVGYEAAIKTFESIPGWKDADEQIIICRNKIEEIKVRREAERLESKRRAEERRIAEEKAAKKRRKIIITIIAVCVCIAFFILLTNVIISNIRRRPAYEKYGEVLKAANVGDTIKFGKYEHDNNLSNGKEDIEWNVLAKEDNRVLLISKYALDCKQYNTELTDVTWETCSLRKWLNETFMDSAFDDTEKTIVKESKVSADKNLKKDTNPGNTTTDKIFLLSINEVDKYYGSNEVRKCVPTEYAKANGAYTDSSYTRNGVPTCWWWLRSLGDILSIAAYVDRDGSVDYRGMYVISDSACVCPAVWVSTK